MSAAALKRELASMRSALASLTPAAPQTLGDPVAWAEHIAGLTLDPWQREVLLSGAPRSADPVVNSCRRQWRVSPRVVLERRVRARADHG